jgi:uroporphyrin-III C-methyltransferase/precorrin-2 dehydrogenase/sirohydrochlorin ferrochelatase/uroporphyrin-III C-methyltransferase
MAEARVYLVGAGPGDPDLLTVKAVRLLRRADVVVFDRLVSEAILDLIPPGTARIFAGKQAGHHHMRQDDINDLLLRLARAGRMVVRLKGGDPFIFGRGSEEAEHLALHGIAFEVVPGITAAAGCSAYAGIPLTHRGYADNVRFVTGHGQDDAGPERDWATLADPHGTLVIYMGLRRLPVLVAGLQAGGLADDTPAAAIERGTTGAQRCVVGTLADLAGRVEAAGLAAPALVVIGRVVSLAGTLDWFAPSAAAHHSAVA